jgi:hypothetical protein
MFNPFRVGRRHGPSLSTGCDPWLFALKPFRLPSTEKKRYFAKKVVMSFYALIKGLGKCLSLIS